MKSKGEAFLGEILKLYFINDLYTITLKENIRPKWLHGLELDYYIPEFNIAFEFQGEQHYDYVYDFARNNKEFLKRVLYDIQKDILCKKEGIILVKINIMSLEFKIFRRVLTETILHYYNCSDLIDPYSIMFKGGYQNMKFCELPRVNWDNGHKNIIKSLYFYFRNRENLKLYNQRVNESKYLYESIRRYRVYAKNKYSIENITNIYRRIFNKIAKEINNKQALPLLDKYIKPSLSLSEIMAYSQSILY